MLAQLAASMQEAAQHRQLDPHGMQIRIYEKQDQFGPGFPHNESMVLPFHITNMCASDMGIFADNPDDFQDWVKANNHNLQDRLAWFRDISSKTEGIGEGCHHYPRAIMGEYLKTRYQEAVQKCREIGIHVHVYPRCEVMDLCQEDNVLHLQIEDRDSKSILSHDVDSVLLATGHWFETDDRPHYFSSPWPAENLRRNIPEGAQVAVIGTSLSAIETLLTLTSEGEFSRLRNGKLAYKPPRHSRMFTLYSRNGLLPKVRGRPGDYKNTFFNRENLSRLLSEKRGHLRLKDVFSLLNSDLEYAYGKKMDWNEVVHPRAQPIALLEKYIEDAVNGDGPRGELIWQTVFNQGFDMVREIYLNLTLEDRKLFDTHYTSLFFVHAATQPSINAEKLLALLKAGIVKVVKLGSNYRLDRNDRQGNYQFIYRDDQGNQAKDVYQYVINARGQQRSFRTNTTPLAKSLIKSGTVHLGEYSPAGNTSLLTRKPLPKSQNSRCAYHTGSVWIDPETHHVIQVDGDGIIKKSDTIYAVGAMTRGQIINASMARGIVQATARVARELVALHTKTAKL